MKRSSAKTASPIAPRTLITGVVLHESEVWLRNVFLWLPEGGGAFQRVIHSVLEECGLNPEPTAIRSHYYTSLQGDDPQITSAVEALRHLGFHPSVFKRTSDGRSKAVDISLVTDMLSHAFLGNYDVALLIRGDEDYLPLVDEVQRCGRIVVVSAFAESGTSPELRVRADYFVDISQRFALSWRAVLGSSSFADFLAP
jgi:uncharacterized LabA/DUF88 family protein